MSEPLTDEEFELLKKLNNNEVSFTEIFSRLGKDPFNSLIATVESLKERNIRLEEDNAILTVLEENNEILLKENEEFVKGNIAYKEENAKLKAAFSVTLVTIKELEEEKAKLKEQVLSKQHNHHESIQGVGRYVCKFYKY